MADLVAEKWWLHIKIGGKYSLRSTFPYFYRFVEPIWGFLNDHIFFNLMVMLRAIFLQECLAEGWTFELSLEERDIVK